MGEKLPGVLDIPEELDVRGLCSVEKKELESGDAKTGSRGDGEGSYRYVITGAIVHVDPIVENDDEVAFGAASEGHYVTFLCPPPTQSIDLARIKDKERVTTWVEVDDEVVRTVDGAAVGIYYDTKPVTASPSTAITSATSGNNIALKVLSGAYNNDQGTLPSAAQSKTDATTSISSAPFSREKEHRYATLVVYSRVALVQKGR